MSCCGGGCGGCGGCGCGSCCSYPAHFCPSMPTGCCCKTHEMCCQCKCQPIVFRATVPPSYAWVCPRCVSCCGCMCC